MANILDWEETGKLMDYRYGFNTYHYVNPDKVPELSPKVEPKPEKLKVDDDFDLFGGEAEPAPVKKPEIKKKEKAAAKSIIVFEVKVFEQEQDLNVLGEKILTIEMDGLLWKKEFKLIPIAYGMQKLEMACVVEDDKVLTDDLFDKILVWEEEVQSVDIVTFQKL